MPARDGDGLPPGGAWDGDGEGDGHEDRDVLAQELSSSLLYHDILWQVPAVVVALVLNLLDAIPYGAS